ncbi:MAG: hydratase [Lachnospiraceae bacterium]|jgi:aconitate hydratase|nr:hydratase [Lachnospiraceae bacterium]
MLKKYESGVYLINGLEIAESKEEAINLYGRDFVKSEAAAATMAYRIIKEHNTSGNMEKLQLRFDKLISHDITFVGIIQTARASGLTHFPIPYVLTNCHNSLCAVGGTINEDDHVFGLSAAKKYGGVYVPPHQAVIHQYAREQMAGVGKMILGSDSHTRYGALGTMAIGEGGPELVKQLLKRTYDVDMPKITAIYLCGEPVKGVGPQDVALAIIKATFPDGFVNNKVMEFVGPGIKNLSADFRIGIDVMTTETTCLSSIWQTDETIEEYYEIHDRKGEYSEITPGEIAYYDSMLYVDLSEIRPMIAMPFHPSNVYEISEVLKNPKDILHEVELRAKISLGDAVSYSLTDKIIDGKLYVEQGIIGGCAGGGFENICCAADILDGHNIGNEEFTLSVYPASQPIFMELLKNNTAAKLMESGALLKTAFCGPCFGAGDTPSNNALSIRHTTRNFPNREGSKLAQGQIASVALMDARSIAATAANKGFLAQATDFDVEYKYPKYHFDSAIYANRVFDSHGEPDEKAELKYGPFIKDWPPISKLPKNLLLKIVSEIHDPVTTTDELIPSGETSSYRSNPLKLAEFALSRKDPEYVGAAKEVQKGQIAIENGENLEVAVPEAWNCLKKLSELLKLTISSLVTDPDMIGIGSTIFAVKPGDGSAREQAASCQRVLGGWANIACEYATKRYRSNLINWGMLPLLTKEKHEELSFTKGDYVFLANIREAIANKASELKAYVVKPDGQIKETSFELGSLTDTEREVIVCGCLMNYYKNK